MTKLEEKATEFAKTEFHRPYSDTPEEAIVIVEPDKYKGFIGGYKEALEDVRKEVERLKEYAMDSKKEWLPMGYNQNAFAEDCRIVSFDHILSFIDNLTK